jgi:alpha-ketoglutarate-dependent taurine dioxygenase
MLKTLTSLPYSETALCTVPDILRDQGVAHVSDTPASLSLGDIVSHWGRVFPQYDRQEVWDVRPVQSQDDAPTSVGMASVSLHTEFCEREGWPPKYVALLCRRDSKGDGNLILADGYHILRSLPAGSVEALRQDIVSFFTEESITQVARGETAKKTVLQTHPSGEQVIQYDGPQVRATGSERLVLIADIIDDADHWEPYRIHQEPGSIVIWNNYRFLHGRTAFTDHRRWLQRVCFDAIAD